MRCQICFKPIKDNPSTHHIYFPRNDEWVKRLCRALREMTIECHQECHDDLHDYFWLNCQTMCHGGPCNYTHICCYYNRRRE